MSSTARILLIVFGSLFGLLLLAFVVLQVSLFRMAGQAQDPVTIKRVAAEFGTFAVPAGYRETFATDILISKTLVISREPPARKSDQFTIVLMKVQLLGVPSGSNRVKDQSSTMDKGLRRAPFCKRRSSLPAEAVHAKIGTIHIRRTLCEDSGLETATAVFSSNGGFISVGASGRKEAFDMGALRGLIASFR
jgi:hypothetical protein